MIRQGGFHEPPLHASIGTAQRGLTPPTLINAAGEIVIRHWLSLTMENLSETHGDVGETVVQKWGIIYANDGMFGSHNPEWLHKVIKVLIGLFRRIILEANIENSKKMNCHPGSIWSGMSAEKFTRRSTGEGANYHGCLK